MQLNQQTDYALRVLLTLAERESVEPSRLYTIREIAEFHQISRNHLMKVVNTLSEHGYVQSQRGRNGGVKLGRPSQDINVGDVVRSMENSWALVECFSPKGSSCRLQGGCGLQPLLQKALRAFWSQLDQCSLADVTTPPAIPVKFPPK